MVWTRTVGEKPSRLHVADEVGPRPGRPSAASTRSLTRTSQSPASLHRREARFVTLPMAA